MLPEDYENMEDSEGGSDQYGDDSADDNNEVEAEFGERIKAMLAFDRPYDSSTEPLPNMAAYHASFPIIEEACTKIADRAVQLLKSSDYRDSETVRLIDQISARRDIKYSPAKKIGMVGNSGAGKSSLINALLDTSDLALEGSSGSACTCVITEFMQASPNQLAPFVAKIVFFDREAREVIIKEHLRDYYRYMSAVEDDTDSEILYESELRANTALEVFKVMFADHNEFATEDTAKDFLNSANSEDDVAILAKLTLWTEELLTNLKVVHGRVMRDGTSVEEIQGKIERFIKTPEEDDDYKVVPSPLPVVNVVRIRLHNDLLSRGLVIADMPGLSDTNTTRVRSTQVYMRQCTYLFVVAPIERIITDTMVNAKLDQGGIRKALICTKADHMNPKTKPKDLSATLEDREEYSRLTRAHMLVGKEVKKLDQSLKQVKGRERQVVTKQVSKLSLKRRALAVIGQEILIRMRSKHVKRVMRKKYSQTLQIHCVSSTDYSSHREGYDEDAIPVSLAVTGIPELRLTTLKLPAASKLEVLRQHCTGVVPSLVSSLEMWISKSVTKRHAELRAIAAKPHEGVVGVISTYMHEIKLQLATTILDVTRERKECWTKLALVKAECWQSWSAATYTAWCRHQGNYKTARKRQFSWNAELLKPVAKDLEHPWAAFDATLIECGKQCHQSLVQSLDTIRDDLSALPDVTMIPLHAFMESLASTKILLKPCLKAFEEGLIEASRNAKLDAITEDQTSFYMRAMVPVYARCAVFSGPGSTLKRRVLFEDAIRRGEPFDLICPGIKDAFEEQLEKHGAKLVADVQKVCKKVLQDFDLNFTPASVKEVDDPQLDELRRQLRIFIDEAKDRLRGPIVHHLALATSKSE